jgi:hypothetical protein
MQSNNKELNSAVSRIQSNNKELNSANKELNSAISRMQLQISRLKNKRAHSTKKMNKYPYPISRDYEKLWELSQKGSIVCYADYRWGGGAVGRDVCQTEVFGSVTQISARGICYVYAESKEDFLSQCEVFNIEWLLPTATHS